MASQAKNKPLFILSLAFMVLTSVAQGEIRHPSQLLRYAPLQEHTSEDIHKIAQANPKFAAEFQKVSGLGFRAMTEDWGAEEYQPLAILIQKDSLHSPALSEFRKTLQLQKRNLMELYKLRNDTYNKLAAMALGIYGNESKFGSSLRYSLKERNQELVLLLKMLSGESDPIPSRGGTQIKVVPEKITHTYPQITPDTLAQPAYSAIATIGFLADTFSMLLTKRHNDRIKGASGRAPLTYIYPENVFDYIPYVYSGQMYKLFNGNKGEKGATVVDNMYIINMRRHMNNFYFMDKR